MRERLLDSGLDMPEMCGQLINFLMESLDLSVQL